MRAFNVAESGAAPELSDIAVPEVTAGTVLVRVAAAGLNPIDNTIAAGHPVGMLPYEYPVVIGREPRVSSRPSVPVSIMSPSVTRS